jgi:hypothetical protein
LIIILVLLVMLHSMIFYFKKYFINQISLEYESGFWNSYHKSSINFLYSALLSWTYNLLNFNDIQLDKIPDSTQIHYWTDQNRKCFLTFYEHLVLLDDSTTINFLYKKEHTYNKINVNFENISYKSSFYLEISYLQYAASIISDEKDYLHVSKILNERFLFEKYKMNEQMQISIIDKVLFYINRNYYTFNNITDNIQVYIKSIEEEFHSFTKQLIFIFEFLILFTSILLIALIRFILYIYDKKFFKILLSMFINLNKNENSNYKSPKELLILKANLKNFTKLLDNIDYDIHEDIEIEKLSYTAKKIRQNYISSSNLANIYNKNDNDDKLITNQTDTKNSLQGSNFNLIKDNKLLNLIHKNTYDKNGNKIEHEEDLQIITIKNVLEDTKHYEIKFVKFAKYLFLLGLIIFITLSVLNIMTSITNFDFINYVFNISRSYLVTFSSSIHLFNHIRLSILNNDINESSDKLFNNLNKDLEEIKLNKTIFINDYSRYLPKTNKFVSLINSIINDENKDFLCPDAFVCELNSKGIISGLASSIRLISLIYQDYKNKGIINPAKQDIKKFFINKEFLIINKQFDKVFGTLNNLLYENISLDTSEVIQSIDNTVIVLGIITLGFNILIVLYVILVFLSRMIMYMEFIIYSANKFNNALYKD